MSDLLAPLYTESIQRAKERFKPLPHVVNLQRAIVKGAQTRYVAELNPFDVTPMIIKRGMTVSWQRSVEHQQRFGLRTPLEDVSLEQYRLLAAAYVASAQVLDQLVEMCPDVTQLETPAVYHEVWPQLLAAPLYRPEDVLQLR